MSSRIKVLEASQALTERPMHSASKKLVVLLIASHKAVWRKKDLIQLIVRECWAALKLYFKRPIGPIEIPRLLPYKREEHFGLVLHFPVVDQSSYAKANFKKIWGSNEGLA